MLQNVTYSVKSDIESLGLFSMTRAGAISQTTGDKLHIVTHNINVSIEAESIKSRNDDKVRIYTDFALVARHNTKDRIASALVQITASS